MQTTRKHGAVLAECYLAPKTCKPAEAGKVAAGEYDRQVKAKGKKHNLGPPHVHVAMAYLEALAATKPDTDPCKFIQTVVLRLNASGIEAVAEVFASFVIKRQFQEEKSDEEASDDAGYVIVYEICPLPMCQVGDLTGPGLSYPLRLQMHNAIMAEAGVAWRQGQAPRGNLERKLQGKLRSLQKKK